MIKPLSINYDGDPQWKNAQWKRMKQFFGMIMYIIDPLWTTDLQWYLCEQLNILNLIGVNTALITLNRPWRDIIEEVVVCVYVFDFYGIRFIVGTFTWMYKSQVNKIS